MEDDLKAAFEKMAQYFNDDEWFLKCSEGDDGFHLVLEAGDRGLQFTDYRKVIARLQEPADKGNADAQFALGAVYADVNSAMLNDRKKAAELFEKAARQGHADAQFRLGMAYASGEGVPQDHGKAIGWYKMAAAQNHAGGQFGVGICYANGTGAVQNYKTAEKWLAKSAAQGHKFAEFNLKIIREEVLHRKQNK